MTALEGLRIADPPELWERLGFDVRNGAIELGGVVVELGAEGHGIVSWRVTGVDGDIDGLRSGPGVADLPAGAHLNGAIGIDHLVAVTPDFDRTAAALEAADLPLKRVRDAGGFRQGFRRLGPAILEVVELVGADSSQPARFWGLVVIVKDLAALAERLGERLGAIHDAVQSGRRIATLGDSPGLSVKLAFMDPEPA